MKTLFWLLAGVGLVALIRRPTSSTSFSVLNLFAQGGAQDFTVRFEDNRIARAEQVIATADLMNTYRVNITELGAVDQGRLFDFAIVLQGGGLLVQTRVQPLPAAVVA